MTAMRELLMERDYDDIPTNDILGRAGVSRGGMYHHFPSKLELFRAAWEASERDNIRNLVAAATDGAADASAFQLLLSGCLAYLEEASRGGELARIGLRQSRAVLGWETWREAATPLGIGVIQGAVEAAVRAGELVSDNVTATTHLILATLIEAGLLISTSPHPRGSLAQVKPEVARIVRGLRS